MTAIPHPRLLSERITNPLRQVARRQWLVLAAVGALRTLLISLASLLVAALLLGSLPQLWIPLRLTVAGLSWVTVVGSAAVFLRPALRRWTLSRAAMHVERQKPDIQERLSSAVELADEKDPHFRGSQALVQHLVRQAEADAAGIRPQQVVRTDHIVRWALALVPVLMAWLLIGLIPATSRTAIGGLYRVLMPWKNELPVALMRVLVTPGDVTLAQGDPIDIGARVSLASTGDTGSAQLLREFADGQKLVQDMQSARPGDYSLHLDDLQQTFRYQVKTDQGDSPWFAATVHPRPQITGIDVRYDFPAYTGLSARTELGKDRSVEALTGTRVTLTVHTALPVVTDKSNIIIDEGAAEQVVLPLKQEQPGRADYQAQLTVTHSGQYKVRLTNEFDLANKDEQPRTIVAIPDEVPTIVIQSPEPQVTVRPDDTVPVKYVASDDFGVTKIEAILQIDEHDSRTVPVRVKAADKRNVTGTYRLSVAGALNAQKLAGADHISYQLKVTDNRDPDPQFSFSAKQTLKIKKDEWQSFQSKLDQKLANELTTAIRKAIEDLDRNRPRVNQVRGRNPDQALDQGSKSELQQAARELPNVTRNLDKAAEEARDTVFDEIAQKVKQIADETIRAAADDAALAEVNADSGKDRNAAAETSVKEITEAHDALQKLLEHNEVQKQQQAADAARELAEAAQKQQEAAELMKPQDAVRHDPTARDAQRQALEKQNQANQKLQRAISQAEALRDEQARQLAEKLQNMIREVEDLQKQQNANAEQAEKQQAATQVQEKANELAKKQEALNKQIAQAAEEHKNAIQQANANLPTKEHQENIVKDLNRNELRQAHDQMKEAVSQLRQAAQQLQQRVNSNDLNPDAKQQEALSKDQQATEAAQNQQTQSNQNADALKQEAGQSAVPKSDDDTLHQAEEAARTIARQAAELGQDVGGEAQQEAQAAQHDADAARQAAEHAPSAADTQEAQRDLQKASDALKKAGEELAQAAQKKMDSHKRQMLKAQKEEARVAAEQARHEAQKQEELAKALEADHQELARIDRNRQPLDHSAQQENQLARETKNAQEQARELGQQAREAHSDNVSHRAQRAQAELAQAEQHESAAAHAQEQASQAEHEAGDASGADQAKAAEQKADEALQQSAQHEQEAQAALARAETELRAVPQELAQGRGEEHQGAEQGEQQGQEAADAHEGGEENGPKHHGQGAKEAARQAAQAAQEAAHAQQEASQQNPAAAQEAARALAEAARAMADAVPGAIHQGEPADEQGQEQADEAGQEPGKGKHKSSHPGQTPESSQGIAMAPTGPNGLPAAVRDIGITPDQWAKLPPMQKKELLNAAQQSGPPTYRQMIKDYYVRIARMQDSGRAR